MTGQINLTQLEAQTGTMEKRALGLAFSADFRDGRDDLRHICSGRLCLFVLKHPITARPEEFPLNVPKLISKTRTSRTLDRESHPSPSACQKKDKDRGRPMTE